MKKKLISFFKDEEGIETMEYALIAALIAIAAIVAARWLGTEASETYSNVATVLNAEN
jgi:Flp pilus assembly pilin Flp